MKEDGTGKARIDLDDASRLYVTGREAYAILDDAGSLSLVRVELESGKRTKLTSVRDPSTLHVVGDWIYFYDTLQFNLYRIRKD